MNTKIDGVKYLKTIGICNNGFNGRGFANPYNVAVAGNGNIYVINRCDTTRRTAIRIGIFTIEEEYLGEEGEEEVDTGKKKKETVVEKCIREECDTYL